MIHFFWIFSRTVCDALGKISLIFVWITLMGQHGNGNFKPLLVFLLYYGVFIILAIFNIIFNVSKPTCSLNYVIGKPCF